MDEHEYAACVDAYQEGYECAYERGYADGLKAQYGETMAAMIREVSYYRSKARFLESQLRKAGLNV